MVSDFDDEAFFEEAALLAAGAFFVTFVSFARAVVGRPEETSSAAAFAGEADFRARELVFLAAFGEAERLDFAVRGIVSAVDRSRRRAFLLDETGSAVGLEP